MRKDDEARQEIIPGPPIEEVHALCGSRNNFVGARAWLP